MPKYSGAYRDSLYDEDEEDLRGQQEQDEAGDAPAPETTASEPAPSDTWQKRYGDLRRHSQDQVKQKDEEIAKLKEQLDSATKAQIRFPKTEAEVAEWVRKYPDVAAIIDTIAQKRALEAAGMAEKKFSESTSRIKELEERIAQEQVRYTQAQAYNKLIELVPDFEAIRADAKFHDWLKKQSQMAQRALYEDNDPFAAAEVVERYKNATGAAPKKKAAAEDAARSVGRGSASAPPSSGKGKWSESRVKSLSDRDYEKYEDEIMDEMRNGTFIYDLSRGD